MARERVREELAIGSSWRYDILTENDLPPLMQRELSTSSTDRPHGAATRGAIILLIEDDVMLVEMLHDRLASRGHTLWHAASGAEAMAIADRLRPDLVIVDLVLPDTHGLVLCANLRQRWPMIPIVVCTASKRPEDAVLSFKVGADDFVRKPFSADELEARLEAALRRSAPHAGAPATDAALQVLGALAIDRARCTVSVGGKPIHLTPTEYRLLCALADPPNHVHSLKDLAQRVWGKHDRGIAYSLQVHIRRMRAKLNASPVRPPALVAVRGFGYQLAWEGEAAPTRD